MRRSILDQKNVPIFNVFAILSTDDTNGVVLWVGWAELADAGGGSGGAPAATASLTLRGAENSRT